MALRKNRLGGLPLYKATDPVSLGTQVSAAREGALNREAYARRVAEDGLGCIEAASDWAEAELRQRPGPPSVANPDAEIVHALHRKTKLDHEKRALALRAMRKTPVLARVTYSDESDTEHEVFVVRGPHPGDLPFRVASNNSPLARLASLQPGDGEMLRIGGVERDLIVSEIVRFQPRRRGPDEPWDSEDTRVEREGDGTFTIPSLPGYFSGGNAQPDDPWADDMDAEGASLLEGFMREIRTGFGLRDNPILDRAQRDIAHMPLASACFVTGPAGTGKTTTMIRRLGLETAEEHLRESGELPSAEAMEAETGRAHAESWIMFSPTDLLKSYVKDAFEREGQDAPKRRLRTWSDFRREIARDTLKLIRSAERRTGLILLEDAGHLAVGRGDLLEWSDDFEAYRNTRDAKVVEAAAALLARSDTPDTATLGQTLEAALAGDASTGDCVRRLERFHGRLEAVIARNDTAVRKAVTDRFTEIANRDPDFPLALVERLLEIRDSTNDSEPEDATNEAAAAEPGQRMTRRQARGSAVAYIRNHMLALAKGRRLPPSSAASRLVRWLGPRLGIEDAEMLRFGQRERELRAARALLRHGSDALSGIVPAYRAFRRERARSGIHYSGEPTDRSHVAPPELDLLVLSALRALREADERSGDIGAARRKFLRAQVLVDEVTDFSPVQLSAMRELAYPRTGSFFLSGDLNQRLTDTGLGSSEALKRVDPQITVRRLRVGYRQSRTLLELGLAIATVAGLPDASPDYAGYNDTDAPRPEWRAGLDTTDAQVRWLADRIAFVDAMGGPRRISIAVFVPDAEDARRILSDLNRSIAHTGREAVDCSDGRATTERQHVGLYSIGHIKGLEFEAVFFLGLDRVMRDAPERAMTTLYVGATRASNHLGVAFEGDVPENLRPLEPHFARTG